MLRKLFGAAMIAALMTSSVLASDRIRVGLNPGPTVDVFQEVVKLAAEQDLDVELIEFTDWVTPNIALQSGDLDVNFFQNTAYLNTQIEQRDLTLSPVASVWVIQSGLHSSKLSSLEELSDGATVAIANDPLNGARGLLLLERAELITLKPDIGIKATIFDIVENNKNLKIVEVEGPQLARALDDVELAAILRTSASPPESTQSRPLSAKIFKNSYSIR